MKRNIIILALFFIYTGMAFAESSKELLPCIRVSKLQSGRNHAKITFENKSNYTMVIKILYIRGGLYDTISLSPYSSSIVGFDHSATYKLKIKATHLNVTSYHDGGLFSVTCTDEEWTEGTMSFSLSSYGTGLGPSISAKEFERNE